MKRLKIISNIKFQFKRFSYYRVDFFIEIISSLIVPLIINYLFWRSIASTNELTYSFHELIIYITLSNIILDFTQFNLESKIAEDIKTFKLGYRLLLPIHYSTQLIINKLSEKLIRLLLIIVPLIIFIIFFHVRLVLSLKLVYFLATALILNCLLSFFIGALCFYLNEIWGISAVKGFFILIFSGAFFPIDILNYRYEKLLMLMPFSYMSYVPSKFFTNKFFHIDCLYYFVPLIWILILSILTAVVWKRGVKKYVSYGT